MFFCLRDAKVLRGQFDRVVQTRYCFYRAAGRFVCLPVSLHCANLLVEDAYDLECIPSNSFIVSAFLGSILLVYLPFRAFTVLSILHTLTLVLTQCLMPKDSFGTVRRHGLCTVLAVYAVLVCVFRRLHGFG